MCLYVENVDDTHRVTYSEPWEDEDGLSYVALTFEETDDYGDWIELDSETVAFHSVDEYESSEYWEKHTKDFYDRNHIVQED